jgi:hypothetical protein
MLIPGLERSKRGHILRLVRPITLSLSPLALFVRHSCDDRIHVGGGCNLRRFDSCFKLLVNFIRLCWIYGDQNTALVMWAARFLAVEELGDFRAGNLGVQSHCLRLQLRSR